MTEKYVASHYKIDKIYSSDLKRAFKTAECLSDVTNLKIITEHNLREITEKVIDELHIPESEKIRKAIGQQLSYIKRNLKTIENLPVRQTTCLNNLKQNLKLQKSYKNAKVHI